MKKKLISGMMAKDFGWDKEYPEPKYLGTEIKRLVRIAMKIYKMHKNDKHNGKECDC